MYTRIEAENLFWLRKNQNKLHVIKYKSLRDHLHSQAEQLGVDVGKSDLSGFTEFTSTVVGRIVILPSTYPGSPRQMHEHYHDSMSIVLNKGAPDLFITL